MMFYLGTHKPHHLALAGVPLMVSYRALRSRRTLPQAAAPWVLDSGGFTELSLHGRWTTTPAAYIADVERLGAEIGSLAWAAPQDWMCEPSMVKRTGLSVLEHQRSTVANFLELDGRGPFIPVLQGATAADYLRHVDMYGAAGIDLEARDLVGVGSVCRRAATGEILDLVGQLADLGLALHGFGVKRGALAHGAGLLFTSTDSLAWSYDARRSSPLPGCSHRSCANCLRYALAWRARTVQLAVNQQIRLFQSPAVE